MFQSVPGCDKLNIPVTENLQTIFSVTELAQKYSNCWDIKIFQSTGCDELSSVKDVTNKINDQFSFL